MDSPVTNKWFSFPAKEYQWSDGSLIICFGDSKENERLFSKVIAKKLNGEDGVNSLVDDGKENISPQEKVIFIIWTHECVKMC